MKLTKSKLQQIIKEELDNILQEIEQVGNYRLDVKFVGQSNAHDQTIWTFLVNEKDSVNEKEIEMFSSGSPSVDLLAEDIVARWGEDRDPQVDVETLDADVLEDLEADVRRQLLKSKEFVGALKDAGAAVDQYVQEEY